MCIKSGERKPVLLELGGQRRVQEEQGHMHESEGSKGETEEPGTLRMCNETQTKGGCN